MTQWKPIVIEDTLITDSTFKTQGWEHNSEDDGTGEKYIYWTLPLPKDNPDGDSICLISTGKDDWADMGIPKGSYLVNLNGYNSLGECDTEEKIEILYKAMTGRDIYEDK